MSSSARHRGPSRTSGTEPAASVFGGNMQRKTRFWPDAGHSRRLEAVVLHELEGEFPSWANRELIRPNRELNRPPGNFTRPRLRRCATASIAVQSDRSIASIGSRAKPGKG